MTKRELIKKINIHPYNSYLWTQNLVEQNHHVSENVRDNFSENVRDNVMDNVCDNVGIM